MRWDHIRWISARCPRRTGDQKSQCNGFHHGHTSDAPFGWAIQLAGSESVWANPTVGQMSTIRRIHFKSTTLVVSTIKEKVTSDGAEKGNPTKRIPLAEKKQHREDQLARLSGITMTGELDPSHMLLDLANQIHESGVIVWLVPSKCSKRDDEVQMSLKDSKSLVQVENSQLNESWAKHCHARGSLGHRAQVSMVHDAPWSGAWSVQST